MIESLESRQMMSVTAATDIMSEPAPVSTVIVASDTRKLEGLMKDIEATDRMGNFEIQRLMS
jgi:hypothetical protein